MLRGPRLILCLLLVSQCVSVWAQQSGAAGNPVDHELIKRFAGAEIVDYRTPGLTNYRLALDRMQRVNGRVSAGREERVNGTLTRITYKIPEGYSGADVFAHYSSQMLAAGPELYRCQGRGCGSSNFWANDMFENRILYGPEAEQYYLASTLGTDEQHISAYLALYVITRGNRSVYAHLDIIELSDLVSDVPTNSPQALALQIQQEGSVILQGIGFDAQDKMLDQGGFTVLLNTLRNAPLMQVYIVAHLSEEGALEEMLARSTQRAQNLVSRLVEAGINERRVLAQGVGPLAPLCLQAPCSERVEVVLRP